MSLSSSDLYWRMCRQQAVSCPPILACTARLARGRRTMLQATWPVFGRVRCFIILVVNNDRFFVDEFRDQVALAACLLITPIIAYFELYVVADYNAQHGSSTLLNTILCVFFAFNFYGNLYKLMRTNPSDEQSSLPSVRSHFVVVSGSLHFCAQIQRSGYRYCHTCKCNAPPRAYHCPV